MKQSDVNKVYLDISNLSKKEVLLLLFSVLFVVAGISLMYYGEPIGGYMLLVASIYVVYGVVKVAVKSQK